MSTYGPRTRDTRALQPSALPRRALIAAAAVIALLAPIGPAGATSHRTVLLSVSQEMSAVAQQVVELGGHVLQTLPIADAMLVDLPTGTAAPAGTTVLPDIPMKVNGTRSYFVTDTPSYRQTIGATDLAAGTGVTVALVDTGVADVPALAGVVTHLYTTDATVADGFGHGTFLAGLIAGQGQFPGVAPGAKILDIQVADAAGNTSLSQVLAGLQAVANDGTAKVLNISLSTGSPLPTEFDPLAIALDRLWDSGVTVVTAAGNDGPDQNTVTAPGSDPLLLTVGALDEAATADRGDDTVAPFSSRATKHGGSKPDLVAPGVSLISAKAPGSVADVQNPGSAVSTDYFRGSGTSMSAAVASGAVATVLAVNPGLGPDAVKALLTKTAYSSKDLQRKDGAGAGALDLAAAVAQAPSAKLTADKGRNDEHADPARGENWGPNEADAQAWSAFAAAWEAGDFEAAKAAWAQLSFQTQQWASRAWSMAAIVAALGADDAEFQSRAWHSRAWSFDGWLSGQWDSRAWSEKNWTFAEWVSRAWSSRAWSSRAWSSRAWSDSDWLSRAWSSRAWSDDSWASRAWSSRAWSSRAWSSRAWSDFAWESRAWSSRAWSSRAWSMQAE